MNHNNLLVSSLDLSLIQERQEIRSYIYNGEIDNAIKKIEAIEPKVSIISIFMI